MGLIPFFVRRTSSDNLPVYVMYRQNRSLAYTQIRKINGDTEAFLSQLSIVTHGAKTGIIAPGVIEAYGRHDKAVKSWLQDLGF